MDATAPSARDGWRNLRLTATHIDGRRDYARAILIDGQIELLLGHLVFEATGIPSLEFDLIDAF